MIVYIAGPYAAASPSLIARNVRRATALGRYAASLGHTPLVPHAQGWAGVYGAGDESESGVRELALRCSRELAARADALWAILRDGGTQSEGTRVETTAHVEASGTVTARTWAQWVEAARQQGVDLGAWARPAESETLDTALDVALDPRDLVAPEWAGMDDFGGSDFP